MTVRKRQELIPQEIIENKIYLIRGEKVMLDRDLAQLYNVKTIALRQQVKRNLKRFPKDFMFKLTLLEAISLVSQNVIPSQRSFGGALPYVFTESGVAMLSSVLNSEIALQVNIQIMRTFIRLKKMMASERNIWQRLNKHDIQFLRQGKEIANLSDKVRFILNLPVTLKRKPKKIGFVPPAVTR